MVGILPDDRYRATRRTRIEKQRPIREWDNGCGWSIRPFTGFDGTVVDADDFRRFVQVVVLVFGREAVICLDVRQLKAAGR